MDSGTRAIFTTIGGFASGSAKTNPTTLLMLLGPPVRSIHERSVAGPCKPHSDQLLAMLCSGSAEEPLIPRPVGGQERRWGGE
jgi:hypothetical protein